jgi:hypothetical protein
VTGRAWLNLLLLAAGAAAAAVLAAGFLDWPWLGPPPQPPAGDRPAGRQAPAPSAPPRAGARPAADPFSRAAAPRPLPVTSAETGLTVVGVLITPQESLVMVRPGPNAEVRRLRPGQEVGGYVVREIHPERLVLGQGRDGPEREIRWSRHRRYLREGS